MLYIANKVRQSNELKTKTLDRCNGTHRFVKMNDVDISQED